MLILIFLKLSLVRIQYSGGADWYNDPRALINLTKFINFITGSNIDTVEKVFSFKDPYIKNYPFCYLTGHGNMYLTEKEKKGLREYLQSGGFLYVDDDYGLDSLFRLQIAEIFPENILVELPFEHEIYNIFYVFKHGPPQVHEHYQNQPPKGYGLFINGRLALYYTYNSNVSDGWTSAHNDSEEIREEALKMGANILLYAITH